MKIEILGERLLVEKVLEENDTTKSGIIIVAQKVRENLGRIVLVGSGVEDDIFQVGKLIIYEKHKGTEIQTDDGEQYIIETQDVYGVIIEEETVSEINQ